LRFKETEYINHIAYKVFFFVISNFWLDPKVTKDQALVSRRSNWLSISKMLKTRYAQTMIIF
ncbi:hypothetical protein, partial [Elizabethkingia meningoseptica]|uniref:hypothetical protein n=1 Tax=Elizabethkingia meningoseptica TaxID=238 RepID=UPI00389141A8